MAFLLALLAQSLGVAQGEPAKVTDGLREVGGIAVNDKDEIFLADTAADTLWKWDGKTLAAWKKKAGHPAGLRFGPDGLLYVCETKNKRVTKLAADGTATVVADTFRGAKFNSPTDLCFDRKGGLYFTDPNFGGDANRTMKIEGVYYVPPGGGPPARVVENLKRPHGIDLWADVVYIVDLGAPPGVTRYRAFPEDPPGALRPNASIITEVDLRGAFRVAYGAPDVPSWAFVAVAKGLQIRRAGDAGFELLRFPITPTAVAVHKDVLYVASGKSLFQVPVKVSR